MDTPSGRLLGITAFSLSLVSAIAYFAASDGIRNFIALLGQLAARAG